MSGEYAVAGVSLILLVVGIVEAAKRFGVEGDASFALALALGVVFGGLYAAFNLKLIPSPISDWIEVVVFSLSFALAATGLYDLGKQFRVDG